MHVAITGASSGIGAALAREYGRHGAAISLVARRRAELEALAAELSGSGTAPALRDGASFPHVCVHDLSDAARATAWLADAERAHGPIDVLINNAGTQNAGLVAEMEPQAAERVIALNLLAPIALTRALLPAMLARGHGAIVNVASVAALAAPPMLATYAASKAGLAAFSESLHVELRGQGVQVLTVYPGPVATPMADRVFGAFGGRKGTLKLLPEGRADVLARRIRAAQQARAARLIYPRIYWLARWFPSIAQQVTALAPLPAPR
jgi:short-subunit dehydrogenase